YESAFEGQLRDNAVALLMAASHEKTAARSFNSELHPYREWYCRTGVPSLRLQRQAISKRNDLDFTTTSAGDSGWNRHAYRQNMGTMAGPCLDRLSRRNQLLSFHRASGDALSGSRAFCLFSLPPRSQIILWVT